MKDRVGKAMERLKAGAREVNLTDPEARFMKTSEDGQITVDKNQFIVATDIGNQVDDTVNLKPMIEQSRSNLDSEIGKVLVDGGYYSGRNLKYIARLGLDVYMPMEKGYPEPEGKINRDDFVYEESTDSYLCPGGERLTFRYSR